MAERQIMQEKSEKDVSSNGDCFMKFDDSFESMLATTINDVACVESKLEPLRIVFKEQCNKRYDEFKLRGDYSHLICNHDDELITLMAGLYAHTQSATKQGKKPQDKTINVNRRKSKFAITKCCGMIVNIEYYQQRKDVLHNIADFFNDAYFTPDSSNIWLVGIDKSIQSYSKFLHDNKLMVCVMGEAWIRWPSYSSKEFHGCSCTGKNWYHGEFLATKRMENLQAECTTLRYTVEH